MNYAPDDIDGEEWKPTEDEASDDDSNCFRRFCLHPELANLNKNNFIFYWVVSVTFNEFFLFENDHLFPCFSCCCLFQQAFLFHIYIKAVYTGVIINNITCLKFSSLILGTHTHNIVIISTSMFPPPSPRSSSPSPPVSWYFSLWTRSCSPQFALKAPRWGWWYWDMIVFCF